MVAYPPVSQSAMTLNESPSEKEGKFATLETKAHQMGPQ